MPPKKPKARTSRLGAPAPRALKEEVSRKAGALIEAVLKPRHVRPPQPGRQFRLVDVAAKWLGSRCYLVAIYRSVDPHPTYPDFGRNFTKMEHVSGGQFALSYMGDNGRWVELAPALSVDECMTAIRDEPVFQPYVIRGTP